MKILSSFKIQIGILICFLFGFPSCEEEDNRFEEKHYPSMHFFQQRSYPDFTFDYRAYEKALENAKVGAVEKNWIGFEKEWTVQGPGNIGARINTVEIDPNNSSIIYAGFSNGGLWKTTDAGENWNPIFDDQTYPSVSTLAIDPNNSDVLWAGTGDVNISGYVFIGDGIYKSEDGGATWEHMGLLAQRIVSKIIVDPNDSNRIYAATMGLPFERNEERGLYRSTDGGNTWEQILFLSDQAGVVDLVMDPFDNNILYASGWDRVRSNSESLISGPNAKIFKTTDGGDNWTELINGLPEEEKMGRTGLAISQLTPGLVYSMFVGSNSQLYGIFKSVDYGENWTPINIDEDSGLNPNVLGGFGWYFGKLRVNPWIDDDLFILGVDMYRTPDGGETWFQATPPWWQYEVHADKHDLKFTNDGSFYLATDGGLYKSEDLGESWLDVENIPTTQFYRVAYNPHQPDLYYGGAQDNGTTGGNAETINEWTRIWGGDGFQMIFHPTNPDVFYVETQNGNITGTDDGGLGSWWPATDGIDGDDRRNWDMPYMMSHFNPDVMYAGTEKLYRSESFIFPFYEPISETLTDTIGPEPDHARFHTISTLHESPINPNFLYVGTTDGHVWGTIDLGMNWTELAADLPKRYVTDVKASPTNIDGVYVSHSGYKDNEFIPHIHYSPDKGENWIDISSDLPQIAINDIYVLPNHQDSIIFVATDAGVYGTLNGGESWERIGSNMPFVPVYDLEWNVQNNEIIAGTFARSIMTYSVDTLLLTEPEDTIINNIGNLEIANKPNIKVYPSPAIDEISLELLNWTKSGAIEMQIFDENGKSVFEGMINNSEVKRIQIDHLPTGTYFIKAISKNEIISSKFVKI